MSMHMTRSLILRLALLLLPALLPAAAVAERAYSFESFGPQSKAMETLRLAPGAGVAIRIDLGEADAGRIAAVREANANQFLKSLQIGVGRPVPGTAQARATALRWQRVEGGAAAHWEIVSKDARALRVELAPSGPLPAGVQVRFAAAAEPGVVYGPFGATEIGANGAGFWSPVLEGERALVEVFVPDGAGEDLPLAVFRVNHLFASPKDADMEALAKASGACQVDVVCRSATDTALASTSRAVARMTFSDASGTYACTGTLLNTKIGPVAPYFYSAAHCISTQAQANTLTTHWFYDRTGCGAGGTSSAYVQLTGGATLLHADASTDVLLLKLLRAPPTGAVYNGWDNTATVAGTAATAVHHPMGDLKKVSLGKLGGFSGYFTGGDTYLLVRWDSVATGTTEQGSSGSGIFTFADSQYLLRGGLYGGPSSCTASSADLFDYYSRFDRAYANLSQYLDPTLTCNYTVAPTGTSAGYGSSTGSFAVTATSGCPWVAVSNASWITSSSSGNGSGTVTYTVAANTGAARSGAISVGGRTFTVSQAAASSANYTGLWWKKDESGWGINFAHQGDVVFGTLYTYDAAGAPLWLSATMWLQSGSTYSGVLYRTRGPALDADPWSPVTYPQDYTDVGTMTVTFSGADAGTLSYNVGSSPVSKPITRMVYGSRSSCTSTTGSRTSATNYQDLWWNKTQPGWGVNLTHQDDTVFATLYTYDDSGRDLWLSSTGLFQGGRTYSGDLYRTTGPAFDANPFTPITFPQNYTKVGTMTFTFTDGVSGTLSYTYNGRPVTRSITRIEFASPLPVCQ